MKLSVVLSVLSLLLSQVTADDPPVVDYTFEECLQHFGKSYQDPAEYARRRDIFEANRQYIREHSSDSSYSVGYNQFTDQLPSELPMGYDKARHPAYSTMSLESQRERRRTTLNTPHVHAPLPSSVDWSRAVTDRGHPITTPVKNQGGCGSCWAFASTAVLESHLALATGTLLELSEQELVSCMPNPRECGGTGGCLGATAELAYNFVAQHGMTDEWKFGYQSGSAATPACNILPSTATTTLRRRGSTKDMVQGAVATIAGYITLPTNDYQSLLYAVATMGPIAVSVAASNWGLYKGGIFDDDESSERNLNHLVVLEGYGTDDETGIDYWLIRNSWGPLWGEDGYIRLKRVDPSTLEDPEKDCKMDNTPADGDACKKDDNGNDIVPQPVRACGTSGILFDSIVPVGARLV